MSESTAFLHLQDGYVSCGSGEVYSFLEGIACLTLRPCLVYSFPSTAFTKHHQRGGLNAQEVVAQLSPATRNLESRCWQGVCQLLLSSSLPAACGAPWLVDESVTLISVSMITWLCPCVPLCLCLSSIRTLVILELGPTLL